MNRLWTGWLNLALQRPDRATRNRAKPLADRSARISLRVRDLSFKHSTVSGDEAVSWRSFLCRGTRRRTSIRQAWF